nr:hypothetical protein Itr_chr11CG16960 [Ipomoea trifida]
MAIAEETDDGEEAWTEFMRAETVKRGSACLLKQRREETWQCEVVVELAVRGRDGALCNDIRLGEKEGKGLAELMVK